MTPVYILDPQLSGCTQYSMARKPKKSAHFVVEKKNDNRSIKAKPLTHRVWNWPT
ncbi:hypothetical protein ACU8KH_04976 [Lachancea thermotolerans]